MILVTVEQLQLLSASKNNAYLKFAEPLNDTMIKYQINTPLRKSHFLSQAYHESVDLSVLNEGLSYSTERLLAIYPKMFKTIEEATVYARSPEKFSQKRYKGFHGRGIFQLTWEENYDKCGKALNIDFVNNKELLEQPKYACLSAGWFWNNNNLNNLADKGGLDLVDDITKVINGGYNGLEDRKQYFIKATKIFGA